MNFLLPILGLLISLAALMRGVYLIVKKNKEKKRDRDNGGTGTL